MKRRHVLQLPAVAAITTVVTTVGQRACTHPAIYSYVSMSVLRCRDAYGPEALAFLCDVTPESDEPPEHTPDR